MNRITVYDIPEGKIHFVLAWEGDRLKMSDMTISPGLYLRDPVRSVASSAMMYLTPLERKTGYYTVLIRVSDVAEFARNYVPENPDPLVDALAEEIRATDALAKEVRDTAVSLARSDAEQVAQGRGT